MPAPIIRRIPWIAAVALVFLSGCYTVIMHPQVENERRSAEELRVQCIDCHVDYHVYPYDPYDHFFGADFYWTNPRYGYYYGYPWWWDDYYWYYYNNPDDPTAYPPEPREYGRPSYRGGVQPRSGGGSSTSIRTGTPVRTQAGTSTASGADAPPEDTAAVFPETRTLDPGRRIIGQPPWSSPKGTVNAKPPALRDGLMSDPEITTQSGGKQGTSSGTISTPPPPPPAKSSTKQTKQAEPPKEEKKSDKSRGRSGRKPQ